MNWLTGNRATVVERQRNPASLSTMLDNNGAVSSVSEWLQQGDSIQDRFAANYSFPSTMQAGSSSSNPATIPHPDPSTQTPHSYNSSMAQTYLNMQSNVSAYTPSLTSYATESVSSVSTGLASRLAGVQVMEERDGILEHRPPASLPIFECAFWFLCCPYTSHDEGEWRTHCLSHFRGDEPPRSVQCPLCNEFRATYSHGDIAWNARMDHMAYAHHHNGQTLRTSRPDFHLFSYLWQKRLIDDNEYKELKGGNYNLSRAPQPYTRTEGSHRDRRRDARNPRFAGRRG